MIKVANIDAIFACDKYSTSNSKSANVCYKIHRKDVCVCVHACVRVCTDDECVTKVSWFNIVFIEVKKAEAVK